MLADAAAGVDVAGGGVAVAVARNATGERAAVRGISSVSGFAALAELSHVSGGAGALLDPGRGVFAVVGSARGFQDDVVEGADAVGRVGGADADGRHVGQDLLEDDGFHARRPLERRMLVKAEGKLLVGARVGQPVALGEDGRGNPHPVSLDDDVVARRPRRIAVHAQLERQVFVVGKLLIRQKLIRGDEVDGFGIGSVPRLHALQERIELERQRDVPVQIHRLPPFRVALRVKQMREGRVRSRAMRRMHARAVVSTPFVEKTVI